MSFTGDFTLAATVLDAALRGTLVLVAALGATALMRRRSAAARHLVWLAALSGVLLLPAARLLVPEWRVVPLPQAARSVAALAPLPAPPVAVAEAAPVRKAGPLPAAPAPGPAIGLGELLAILWAAGAGLVAARLLLGLARVWWMEWRAVELNDDEWLRLTDGLSRRLRLGRMVRLLRGAGATVPMTWGVFRPVILLPGEADGWSDERRRVVLAHELAHVRRWDALTQWIAHLAVALFWFNPLVWIAARKLREEREHACDDAVLRVGARPADYADHLLTIVRSLGSSGGPVAALAMARRSQFEGRLLSILDSAAPRDGVSRAAGLAVIAAAALAVLPLAALQAVQPAAQEPSVALAGEVPARAEPVRAEDAVAEPGVAVAAAPVPGAAVARPAPAARGPEAPVARTVQAPAASIPETPAPALATHPTQRQLLDAVAGGDPGLYAEVIRAAEEIVSASSRRAVLMELLRRPDLSPANLAALVGATRTMSSDLERRVVLEEALSHPGMRAGELPGTFFGAVDAFASDLERRTVLAAVTERPRLSQGELVSVFRLVLPMRSSLEKRTVLQRAAERHALSGGARDAYLAAARSIPSELERGTALQAMMAHGATPPPTREARRRERSVTEYVWNADHVNEHRGRRVLIDAKGVVYRAARWDVVRLNPGGRLVVEERRASGDTCRVEVSRGPGGELVYAYRRNGEARPYTRVEQGWMAEIIREFTGS